MDSKIIRVINKMIEKSNFITEVTKGLETTGEYFFLYNKKFKWSTTYNETQNEYMLFFYPMEMTISQLAYENEQNLIFLTYRASEFKSQEATESFRELYDVVKSKLFGIDQILDDILADTTF